MLSCFTWWTYVWCFYEYFITRRHIKKGRYLYIWSYENLSLTLMHLFFCTVFLRQIICINSSSILWQVWKLLLRIWSSQYGRYAMVVNLFLVLVYVKNVSDFDFSNKPEYIFSFFNFWGVSYDWSDNYVRFHVDHLECNNYCIIIYFPNFKVDQEGLNLNETWPIHSNPLSPETFLWLLLLIMCWHIILY